MQQRLRNQVCHPYQLLYLQNQILFFIDHNQCCFPVYFPVRFCSHTDLFAVRKSQYTVSLS